VHLKYKLQIDQEDQPPQSISQTCLHFLPLHFQATTQVVFPFPTTRTQKQSNFPYLFILVILFLPVRRRKCILQVKDINLTPQKNVAYVRDSEREREREKVDIV